MRKKFGGYSKCLYLCTAIQETRCSAVRLAHLVWDQRVGGSNPFTSTENVKEKKDRFFNLSFFVYTLAKSLVAKPQTDWSN